MSKYRQASSRGGISKLDGGAIMHISPRAIHMHNFLTTPRIVNPIMVSLDDSSGDRPSQAKRCSQLSLHPITHINRILQPRKGKQIHTKLTPPTRQRHLRNHYNHPLHNHRNMSDPHPSSNRRRKDSRVLTIPLYIVCPSPSSLTSAP
jgi:hypothetical protein